MIRLHLLILLFCFITAYAPAYAYDEDMAAHFSRLFADVKGADAARALHYISAEQFVSDIKAKKKLLAIDVRTPAETELLALSLPASLTIPVNRIFEKAYLDRIPTDRPVVIICKSGARATAVGTSLRHIGFDNVYILSGGFQGLVSFYGISQANMPGDR